MLSGLLGFWRSFCSVISNNNKPFHLKWSGSNRRQKMFPLPATILHWNHPQWQLCLQGWKRNRSNIKTMLLIRVYLPQVILESGIPLLICNTWGRQKARFLIIQRVILASGRKLMVLKVDWDPVGGSCFTKESCAYWTGFDFCWHQEHNPKRSALGDGWVPLCKPMRSKPFSPNILWPTTLLWLPLTGNLGHPSLRLWSDTVR